MAMVKSQKVEYVKKLQKEIASYKTAAIMPIDGVPDRLLQKVRNELKPDARMIIARKTLLSKAVGKEKLELLGKSMDKNFALVLSNKEPFELYKTIHSSKLRLGAKPNQIAPEDIRIEPGDTNIAPGQTVTELKSAGVDVQIQKGKVIISKGKVLVEKGKKITGAVANALKILDIKPFEIAPRLSVALFDNLSYSDAALGIDEEFVRGELLKDFAQAYAISLEAGIVTQYNANVFIMRAYRSAIALGLEAKVPEDEIVKMLMANAAAQAGELAGKTGVDTE
ncbi:MAG: 50S ribosomal protein L10 [Candidatus Marsarchaeota archaeon]|nr:50S ribosomal protein L10 [Candidatus Marsarchaeota archaeon]